MSTPGTRLDSWKEIARYLRRYERTVQRWELECGLPIHRLSSMKRGGVFAYTEELDAWLAESSKLMESESEPNDSSVRDDAAEAGPEPERSEGQAVALPGRGTAATARSVSRFPRTLLLASLFGVVLLACIPLSYYLGYRRSTTSDSVEMAAHIQQLTFRRGNIQSARFRPSLPHYTPPTHSFLPCRVPQLWRCC